MFTYPRRKIATVGLALSLGLFSTTAVPVVTGSTGQASAKAKAKVQVVKKTSTTRQS